MYLEIQNSTSSGQESDPPESTYQLLQELQNVPPVPAHVTVTTATHKCGHNCNEADGLWLPPATKTRLSGSIRSQRLPTDDDMSDVASRHNDDSQTNWLIDDSHSIGPKDISPIPPEPSAAADDDSNLKPAAICRQTNVMHWQHDVTRRKRSSLPTNDALLTSARASHPNHTSPLTTERRQPVMFLPWDPYDVPTPP